MTIIKFTKARKIAFTIFVLVTILFSYMVYGMWFNISASNADDSIMLAFLWFARILGTISLFVGYYMVYVFLTRPSKVLDNNKLW